MKRFFFLFFVFVLCKDTTDHVTDVLQNTFEIQSFCQHMTPCIEEEVERAFSDMPQQKLYLKSKISIKNCSREQARLLLKHLQLKETQLQHVIEKEKIILSFDSLIALLEPKQKEVLGSYVYCSNMIAQHTGCREKKEILKTDSRCAKIFPVTE